MTFEILRTFLLTLSAKTLLPKSLSNVLDPEKETVLTVWINVKRLRDGNIFLAHNKPKKIIALLALIFSQHLHHSTSLDTVLY